jgi:hypothetical protein
MDLRRHYFERILTIEQLQAATAIFAFVYTVAGISAVVGYKNDKRKMAWIISLVNSFVLSVASSSYFVAHIVNFIRDGRGSFHAVNDVSVLICIWLFLANFFDLLFGLIFYRAQLDPVTAYVHHTLYLWITIVAAFGTGGFADFEPFAGGVAVLLVEEIPTFLLAAGSVFPAMRTDVGFGVTFFLLRVMFHAAMMAYSVYSGIALLPTVLFGGTLTMHVFWFFSWQKGYRARLRKNSKEK